MSTIQAARAFALVGDRYHNSDYIRTGLKKTLVEELGLAIDFTDEVELLNGETLAQYPLLIVFRDGMHWPDGYGLLAPYPGYDGTDLVSDPPVPEREPRAVQWISEEQGRAVRAFVEAGGAALFYHNSTYISPGSEDFRHVLGSITEGHPPVRPYRVEIVDKEHPITQGVRDFVVTDEQHYMHYDKEPENVLAMSANEHGHAFKELGTRCQAAWAYDYGQGRVCYLSPGHTIAVLWNPEYEKMQQNAVRWLLRQI